MKAVILSSPNNIVLENVPLPEKAAPGHLIIEMYACAINSGDKLFFAGAFPRGIPVSRYNIAGVSGAGKVIELGKGVPIITKTEMLPFIVHYDPAKKQ